MAHIEIHRRHGLGMAEAKAKVAVLEPKLEAKYRIVLSWKGEHDADIKGPGVKGAAHLDGENLRIEVELGMLLRPMAKKLQGAVESAIDEALRT